MDETSINVKKVWMYLYRAVDSEGNTLAFLLSQTRDAEAAARFFCNALHVTADAPPHALPSQECVASADSTTSAPRVINVEKNAAYPKAIADLKAAGILPEPGGIETGQLSQYLDRARSPLYQTFDAHQGWAFSC